MAGTATGAAKRVAAIAGVTLDEFTAFQEKAIHWCVGCKAFHPRDDFGRDCSYEDGRARTCRFFRNSRARGRYVRVENPRFGPSPHPPRDGDKAQARQRINVLVRTGRLPHPNSLPCADCNHEHVEGERRHEYDHHLGYAAEHHLDVEAVCTLCHFERGVKRGELPSDPRNAAHRRRREEVVASG